MFFNGFLKCFFNCFFFKLDCWCFFSVFFVLLVLLLGFEWFESDETVRFLRLRSFEAKQRSAKKHENNTKKHQTTTKNNQKKHQKHNPNKTISKPFKKQQHQTQSCWTFDSLERKDLAVLRSLRRCRTSASPSTRLWSQRSLPMRRRGARGCGVEGDVFFFF